MEDAKKDAAKYVTERILPYSPIRDTVDQRVYEIMRYKYQRPVHKDPNYLKPKLPKDFYDTETRLRMGDNERSKAIRAEEEKREAGERDIMAEEERLARYGPRIKMNLVGAGQGWQSPFEMLYTQEEKELMGLLNGKNPLIRIKPDPGGEVGGPNYDHSQRHRWGQD